MLSLVIGMGIVVFLMIYLSSQLDETHNILKLFLMIMGIFMLLYIPATLIVEDCEILLNYTHESYQYGDNYTGYHWEYNDPSQPDLNALGGNLFHRNITYTYDKYCFDPENSTAQNFYKTYVWITRFFLTYFFIYLIYWFFNKTNGLTK